MGAGACRCGCVQVGVGVDMGAGMGLVQGECELFYVCGRKHVDTAVMFATCCN